MLDRRPVARAARPHRGLKIGIAWQGNPDHGQDRFRSIPLLQFAPLAGIAGVRLLSLQKDPGGTSSPWSQTASPSPTSAPNSMTS